MPPSRSAIDDILVGETQPVGGFSTPTWREGIERTLQYRTIGLPCSLVNARFDWWSRDATRIDAALSGSTMEQTRGAASTPKAWVMQTAAASVA
jgi:hypothetical protein